MGPVRVGNQAYEQIQHDAYGQIVPVDVQAFFDQRLLRMAGVEDFEALEEVGERAWEVYDKPDAGLWELRTTTSGPHLFGGDVLGGLRPARQCRATRSAWRSARPSGSDRADKIRARRSTSTAWREETQRLSATFGGDDLDASLIQLLDLRFLPPDDPPLPRDARTRSRQGLRRGSNMLRYATEDDFGLPKTAFNVCTFWLIEALQRDRAQRGCARAVRGDADPPHRRRAAVGGYRPGDRRTVGQLSADLFAGRHDQLRRAAQSKPWTSMRDRDEPPDRHLQPRLSRRAAQGGAPGRARRRAVSAALREINGHLVRLVGRDAPSSSPATINFQTHRRRHHRDDRPRGAGHRRILQRLRQPHAVAAVPLPHRSRRVRARLRRRLSARQRALRRHRAAADRARRPRLGAGLSPDPARARTAQARLRQPDRLLPPHPLAAACACCSSLPSAPRAGRDDVRLRRDRLPHRGLAGRLPRLLPAPSSAPKSARTAIVRSATDHRARSPARSASTPQEFVAAVASPTRAADLSHAMRDERGRPRPDRRRRPARLFQGAGGALPRLRALPGRPSRAAQGRCSCSRSRRRRAATSTATRRSAPRSTACRAGSTAPIADVDWVPIRYVNQGYPRDRARRHLSRRARSGW